MEGRVEVYLDTDDLMHHFFDRRHVQVVDGKDREERNRDARKVAVEQKVSVRFVWGSGAG